VGQCRGRGAAKAAAKGRTVVTQDPVPEVGGPEAAFDTSKANPARVWDYWLGGKDNFAADREAARKVLEIMPSMPLIARSARRFLAWAVHDLTAERGIRQFLDLGTGLPTADNTHEVAQRAASQARVVYVDNDPMVLSHARALLTGTPGATDYIHADLRDTSTILKQAAGTLDLSQPVAVMLIAVLHFISDADDPYRIVDTLMDAVPSGSYLVLAHGASDILPTTTAQMSERYNELSAVSLYLRSREEIARFFDGLELVEPGLAPLSQWAPGASGPSGDRPEGSGVSLSGYCGVARKP
jgi:S-adenosyl methyltransferase